MKLLSNLKGFTTPLKQNSSQFPKLLTEYVIKRVILKSINKAQSQTQFSSKT